MSQALHVLFNIRPSPDEGFELLIVSRVEREGPAVFAKGTIVLSAELINSAESAFA